MRISTNQFVKKSFTTGGGAFADQITPSNNQFSRKSFIKSLNGWQGPNTSEMAFGVQDPFGGPDSTYGSEGQVGGLAHFGLRTPYNVSH